MKKKIRRRQFLTRITFTTLGSVAYFASRHLALGAVKAEQVPSMRLSEAAVQTDIYVIHGTHLSQMLEAGIEKMGGWQAFVKAGQKAVLKPNAAWACQPEQGANTTPQLVEGCVMACLAAGASEVVVPENPCSPARYAFSKSGIEESVNRAGGRMYCPRKPDQFRNVKIPKGKSLKQADVVCDVLDTRCLVNMPIAKTHSSAILTLSMKNWMGSVRNRKIWHIRNLHQCIADFSTFIKPSLIIMDATRIMTTRGPRGPGKMAFPNQLVFGTDPVAVDAYSATLFGKQPFDIPHIKIAHEMRIGCGDLTRIHVEHVQT